MPHILISKRENTFFDIYSDPLRDEDNIHSLTKKKWIGFDLQGKEDSPITSPQVEYYLIMHCSNEEMLTAKNIKYRVIDDNELNRIDIQYHVLYQDEKRRIDPQFQALIKNSIFQGFAPDWYILGIDIEKIKTKYPLLLNNTPQKTIARP